MAVVDAGGNLRVGPESAGADPGPVCYGRGGTMPTVTDAHVVLGRLPADDFLGGHMPLFLEKALQAFKALAPKLTFAPRLGLDAIQTLAWGVIDIANAHMERALRIISVERGEDPREMVLVSFGGAGGLHACDLARALGVPQVLVSPMAATLSALGMLAADVQWDYVQTVMLPDDIPYAAVNQHMQALMRRGEADLKREGLSPEHVVMTRTLDVRYVGQSFELNVPFTQEFRHMFDRMHQDRYGYSRNDAPIEIVNVRMRTVGQVTPPSISSRPLGSPDSASAIWEERPVVLPHGIQSVPHYWGNRLSPGQKISGPAILVLEDTTVCLGMTDKATLDTYSNIFIDVGPQYE